MSSTSPEMILVPAGEFPMGEGADARSVYVAAFSIAKYPITNRAYRPYVDASGRGAPRHWQAGFPHALGDHPLVNVTWHDALGYCRWLSESTGHAFRLPTEAEWEKAARGGHGRTYPWGNVFDPTRCNCGEAGVGGTTPVDLFDGASPYGVRDMAGNVWEWCSSQFAEYPYRADDGREDPAGEAWRCLRGGSWLDYEWGVRPARRLSSPPVYATHNTGFRVVQEVRAVAEPGVLAGTV